MHWFHHLKIANKLLVSFFLVIAMTCAMGIFSIVQLVKVSNSSADIAKNWMPATRHIGEVQTSLARFRISEATHFLQDDEAAMKAADKALSTRRDIMRKQQESLAALVSAPEEKRIYAELQQDMNAYMAESTSLTALSHAGNKDEARALFRVPPTRSIASLTKHVSDVVGEISASSVEQRSGIEEINKAIVHIDETTQQNAALLEQAAAAAAALQEQAAQLATVVSRFRLEEA